MERNKTKSSKLRGFVDRMPLDPKRPRQFGVLAFLEATFVPMPIEIITAPFMIAYPKHALKMAWSMWIGCIIASAIFYALGFLLFEPMVQPALAALGVEDRFHAIHEQFNMNGLFWTVLTLGLLPMPLQLVTLGAGLMKGNILVFAVAVAASRGIRYFGLAALSVMIGPKIETILTSKRFGAVLALLVVTVLGLLFWLIILPAMSKF